MSMEKDIDFESRCSNCCFKKWATCTLYDEKLIKGANGVYLPCDECETDRLLRKALTEYVEDETDDFIKRCGDVDIEVSPFDYILKG